MDISVEKQMLLEYTISVVISIENIMKKLIKKEDEITCRVCGSEGERLTFEEYLQVQFMKDAPEEVGDKDSFEDNFNNWLEYQGADMLIQYAEAWGKTLN